MGWLARHGIDRHFAAIFCAAVILSALTGGASALASGRGDLLPVLAFLLTGAVLPIALLRMAADRFAVGVLSSSGKGEALADELGGFGVTGSNQSTDDLARLVDGAVDRWGRIDVLVNSARHLSARIWWRGVAAISPGRISASMAGSRGQYEQ